MKDLYRRWVPSHLRFLLVVHLILLVMYSLFRYVTLIYNRPSYFFQMDRTLTVRQAFKIGLWFDITVASYALLLPYLLLTIAYIWPREHRRLFAFTRFYCGAIILVSLIICAADVPYFNFFNSRLTTAAVHWKNNVQVAKYILSEVKYYPFILICAFCIWGIGRLIRKIWHGSWKHATPATHNRLVPTAIASVLMLGGLWGGATPKTPDLKRATFSNDGFINQLTLNPVHTWFDSYFAFDIHLTGIEKAFSEVQEGLGITKVIEDRSPIAREHDFQQPARRMNVVLVLMESMSADRMGIFGNPKNLTPNLDSLARKSIFFDNCFSNGIHTNAGLYSSIYGMPIIMMQHPMNNGRSEYLDFTGLPMTLKEKGYSTEFFCTHPKTFDNLDVFLQKNGYDRISDLADYPTDKIANSWGVGDETLFEHALETMDSLATVPNGKPFFSTLLTITTHPPFILPAFTKFKPRSTDPIEITYEYTDWAIRNFMDACAQKSWYDNTIFVFVGDHGVNIPGPYDVPLSYNHVPLIIHAPSLFSKPEIRHQLANQTDIFPTVMGLIGEDYVQNTLGFDLFRERRPFAFFSQDHKMGVLNERFLYVARKSGKETLIDYRGGSLEDISHLYPALVDSMRHFGCANLQVSQWMIENDKVK
ncbi:MAG: LTA synthase family protein [Bacteroidetes bacterium]|nr:LTA synthase family protein [Bacteroidota bacterium]